MFDIDGTLQLLNSDHVREREIRRCFVVSLLGVSGMGFFLGRYVVRMCLVGFTGVVTLMVIFSGIVLFHLLLRSVNILSFMILLSWIRLLGLGASFGMVGYPFSLVLMVVLLGLKPLLKALLIFWSVLLGGILLVSLLSGSYLLILMLMVLLLGLRMILMFGLMVVWLMIEVPGFLLLVRVASPFGIVGFGVAGVGVIGMTMFVMVLWFLLVVVSAQFLGLCRLFKGLNFGVSFLHFRLVMVFIYGVDNLGVVRHEGRILDGKLPSRPFELLPDGDLLFLIHRTLRIRGLGSVRISKVKGPADEAMVRTGTVRGLDKLGNDGADEAAEFGRRRVLWWVIDARRNLSGVCSRWRPLVLVLHRFFIAISRAVVNHGRWGMYCS